MRLSWYAVLCFGICAGCAEHPERDDDTALLSRGKSIDAGLIVPCDRARAGEDGGAIDAAAPDAQAPQRCDVVFGTRTASGDDRATIAAGTGELVLRQWAENRSAQVQILRFRRPCRGTLVTGLGDYDAHRSCLAGACQTPAPATEMVLAPGERAQLGVAYVEASANTCNRTGLATGIYEVGYQLIDLSGASVCSETLHLTVR